MSKNQKRIFLGVCALWFLYALTFTPSGDDLVRIYHNGDIGHAFTLIPTQYQSLNGRVLGNLLSFLGAGPAWLRALVKAGTTALLSFSLWKTADKKATAGLLTSVLLVTAIPLSIHTQVYAWSSGFYNYTIPLAILAWFAAGLTDRKQPHPGIGFLLGFASCLFVEHVTAFLFVAALGIFYLCARKQAGVSLLAFAVGVFCGTLLMFASPVYHQVMEGADNYRDVPSDAASLFVKVTNNLEQMGPYLLARQNALPFLLFGTVWVLVKAARDRILWTILFAALVVLFFSVNEQTLFSMLMANWPWAGAALVLLLHFGIAGFLLLRAAPKLPLHDRGILRGAVLSWIGLLAPLALVNPIGPRNFYAGTIALVLLVLVLLKTVHAFRFRQVAVISALLLFGLILWRGWAHGMNTAVFLKRDRIIKNAMAEHETNISIPPFPYPDFIHGSQNEKLGNLYHYEKSGDILFPVEGEEETE